MTIMRHMREVMTAKVFGDQELRHHVNRLWPAAKSGGWADFAFQNSGGMVYEADRLAAVTVMGWFEVGRLAAFKIEVGHKPSPDKERDKNQKKLDEVPYPFDVEVCQVNTIIGVADGVVSWDEEIKATLGNGESVVLRPGSVPLEIGYMPSGKTQGHIITGHYGGLARWPYGSTDITVLIPKTRPDLWPQERNTADNP